VLKPVHVCFPVTAWRFTAFGRPRFHWSDPAPRRRRCPSVVSPSVPALSSPPTIGGPARRKPARGAGRGPPDRVVATLGACWTLLTSASTKSGEKF
jgi:hypothetical protein